MEITPGIVRASVLLEIYIYQKVLTFSESGGTYLQVSEVKDL